MHRASYEEYAVQRVGHFFRDLEDLQENESSVVRFKQRYRNIVIDAIHHPDSLETLLCRAPPDFIDVNACGDKTHDENEGELAVHVAIFCGKFDDYRSLQLLLKYPATDLFRVNAHNKFNTLLLAAMANEDRAVHMIIENAKKRNILKELFQIIQTNSARSLEAYVSADMLMLFIREGLDCNYADPNRFVLLNQYLDDSRFFTVMPENEHGHKVKRELCLLLCKETNLHIAYNNASLHSILFTWPPESIYNDIYAIGHPVDRWYKTRIVLVCLIHRLYTRREEIRPETGQLRVKLPMELLKKIVSDRYLSIKDLKFQ